MAKQLATKTRLRLTKRGRVVFTTLISLLIVVALFWLSFAFSSGATASAEPATASFETVSVAYGESLWQIAARIAPDEDPRDVIDELIRLNHLSESMLRPGQILAVPLRLSETAA